MLHHISSLADASTAIRAARRTGWTFSFTIALLLLQSALWSSRFPWLLTLSVAGLGTLSAFSPALGLLILAAVVSFGQVLTTRVWHAYPLGLSEAWVLAFLAGYLWWRRRDTIESTAPADRLTIASWSFAIVVLTSCAVQLAFLQVWHDYPLRYAVDFLHFLVADYLTTNADPRPWVDGRGFVTTAVMLVGGVALLRCASHLCGCHPSLGKKLTLVMVLSGTLIALWAFSDVAAFASDHHLSIWTAITSSRFASPAIPSLDTTGAYFILVAFLAAGTATISGRHLLPSLLALAATLVGLASNKTRAAIVAGAAMAAAALVWWQGTRFRSCSPVRTMLLSTVVAAIVGVGVIVYNPFHILAVGGNASLHYRVLFATTALRMLASAPLAGVGIGQYEMHYRDFAGPELLTSTNVSNAHNYFLWVAAELGPFALGLFVWILAEPLWRGVTYIRAHRSDYWFLATFAGLMAFMITWTVGQPLAVPQVGFTFWILLGLVDAHPIAGASLLDQNRRLGSVPLMALAVGIVVVVGSLPIRAHRAVSEVDFSRVTYGFYNWDTTNGGPRLIAPAPADGRFRWTGRRATFFIRSSVRAVDLPLTASLAAVPAGVQVDIRVNWSEPRRVTLDTPDWRTVRIEAPAAAGAFWRIDLHAAPTWVPRNILRGSTDARELGVAVGQISRATGPPPS